jgi:excisionase family DNA binding protein
VPLAYSGTIFAVSSNPRETSVAADTGDLVTTGVAAKILGTSRQHVVDLCDRGDLPFLTVGKHRRVSRADLEVLASRTRRLTRDQLRSLWISQAVAGKIVRDPDRSLALARRNLAHLRSIHTRGQGARWLAEWEPILDGPVEKVLETLTSPSPRARELRQNSPFASLLTDTERAQILRSFQRTRVANQR